MSSPECPPTPPSILASFIPSLDGWQWVSFTHHREKWLGWHLCEGEISTIALTYCSIESCFVFGDITEFKLILLSVHTLNYIGPHLSLQKQIQPTLIQSDTAYTK